MSSWKPDDAKHVNIQKEAYAIRDLLSGAPKEELERIAYHNDPNPQYALAKRVAQQLLDAEALRSSSEGFKPDNSVITSQTGKQYKLIDTGAPGKTILQEAHGLIYGDREADYGDPKENLANIGQQWSLYLSQKYGAQGVIVDAVDVCWMMALLKMCRELNGGKRDSLVDAAGYIGLIERVMHE